ncbi:DoxX family protein [Streptomyces spiramenti]|uniref:DoxX family protein n=1 Tax=Streptomyces spiramenti TaxID=2720606 RepID=A0ABX1AFV0_9ACTN|nr:DoxX family protein [Streptomyces spiramenti]NJP65999.1 DoxX family protein [Streptomyces spiramenti]
MVKVPCDPAQIIVNHASFRVEFAAPSPPAGSGPRLEGAPMGSIAIRRSPAAARTRRPVVWTGQAAPGDTDAGGLLQAVRQAGEQGGVATQLLPRVTDTATLPKLPSVVGPRGPEPGEGGRLTRDPREAFDSFGSDPDDPHPPAGNPDGPGRRPAGKPDARQGYYPGRNMSLGIVLLPLRLLLGFITITAGFAKLTDPVYFDGGERGSMVTWLSGLEPWALAGPLHDWALAHPVGAGLTVAFVQIIVGVLTIAGLWQRFAAAIGALLSLALLVTVSWQSGPAYDAPDIILLAAWSPMIIAGAPVYSLDARLSGEAWRTLGPRVAVNDLRRRVLRRGGLVAMLLVGTTLLLGSLLGSAVRSAELNPVTRPGELPRNSQQGITLPGEELDEDVLEENATEAPATGGAPGGATTPGEQPAGGAESPEEEAAEDSAGPATEQTVPDSGSNPGTAPEEQPAPPAQQPAPGQEAPAPPPPVDDSAGGGAGGAGGEEQAPPEEPGAPDEGGGGSSLGRIGGLLG